MTVTDFCKRMDKETKIAINRWAKRLEADEVTIHQDGSVTLMCEYGGICEHYRPSAKELFGKGCGHGRT